MDIHTASFTVVTENLGETRRFYVDHFDAKPTFDCGWYVVLRLNGGGPGGSSGSDYSICLMEPKEGMVPFSGGAFLNIEVENADDAYSRLTQGGLVPVIPIEDHPWGDRGFGVLDPSGIVVYCYHTIKPSPEFEPYFMKAD